MALKGLKTMISYSIAHTTNSLVSYCQFSGVAVTLPREFHPQLSITKV